MSKAFRRTVQIDGREIGPEHRCFVIAEIGVNHNGDADTALRMIDAIADTGADCVKFQTFHADEFCNSTDETYEYVSQGKVVRESMLEMFRRLELKYDEFSRLFNHARQRGLIAMSTPTDVRAVEALQRLGVGGFKVGSDDLVYTPFLQHVARTGKPMIISTGMADAADVERAAATIQDAGNDQLVILHCVSLYPTPLEQVNLRRIETLRSMYDCPIGFSDHSFGITAALGAVSLGACVIEKHFTLDRDMPGPDHRFSADPSELTAMVREIRALESNLGSGRFAVSAAEKEMAALARRSIVLERDRKAGTVLKAEDLVFRRPGTGMMPYRINEVIGRRLIRDTAAGTPISLSHLED